MTIKDWKHPGLFAAGVLFGTAGIKALSSKVAKKLIHQLIQRCSSRKESCYGYRNNDPGECGRYLR